MEKFEIAKDGFNVLTTADKNKVYSSKYRTYKVNIEDSVEDTISSGDSEEVFDVSHNLGYRPVVYAWLSRSGENHEISGFRVVEFPSSVIIIASWYHLNSNTLRFILYPNGATQGTTRTFRWTYKIMVDEF